MAFKHREEFRPSCEVEAIHEAGGAVGHDGGAAELLSWRAADDGLVSGIGIVAGDPEAAGAVAPFSLGADQARKGLGIARARAG